MPRAMWPRSWPIDKISTVGNYWSCMSVTTFNAKRLAVAILELQRPARHWARLHNRPVWQRLRRNAPPAWTLASGLLHISLLMVLDETHRRALIIEKSPCEQVFAPAPRSGHTVLLSSHYLRKKSTRRTASIIGWWTV